MTTGRQSSAPNGAVLTVHEAAVHTTEVSIQVLKVGKKQVTMGLFRQLPQRSLTAYPRPEFVGEPWGYVNYWWDGDGRQDFTYSNPAPLTALHIVWTTEGRLYRDVVYAAPNRNALANAVLEEAASAATARSPG
jgi:hypothetical protein